MGAIRGKTNDANNSWRSDGAWPWRRGLAIFLWPRGRSQCNGQEFWRTPKVKGRVNLWGVSRWRVVILCVLEVSRGPPFPPALTWQNHSFPINTGICYLRCVRLPTSPLALLVQANGKNVLPIQKSDLSEMARGVRLLSDDSWSLLIGYRSDNVCFVHSGIRRMPTKNGSPHVTCHGLYHVQVSLSLCGADYFSIFQLLFSGLNSTWWLCLLIELNNRHRPILVSTQAFGRSPSI